MAIRQEQQQTTTLTQRLELLKPIETDINSYKPFLEITGDDNPLHTDEDYSKKTPFKGIIVPGLYLALAAYSIMPKGMDSLELTFHGEVRPHDEIRAFSEDGKIVWYRVSGNAQEPVLTGKPGVVNNSQQKARAISLHDDVGIYDGMAKTGDIRKMLGIARMIDAPERALHLHAAGYVSPALLKFRKEGVTGAYAKQKFTFHSQLEAGEEFKVIADKGSEREYKGQNFINFAYNLRGSDGRMVVSGTALVAEIRHDNRDSSR